MHSKLVKLQYTKFKSDFLVIYSSLGKQSLALPSIYNLVQIVGTSDFLASYINVHRFTKIIQIIQNTIHIVYFLVQLHCPRSSVPLCCRWLKIVLSQILSNVLLPRHPQHFFLILIQLRVVIRWSLEERITASESWRQMQELPSCPLEETLQSIMEIDSVCVSNLETTANRNPTRRDTINHNRRDVSVCSERSRSPAVFSVKWHCIIIKAGACWVYYAASKSVCSFWKWLQLALPWSVAWTLYCLIYKL